MRLRSYLFQSASAENILMTGINTVHRIVWKLLADQKLKRSATALGTRFWHQGSRDRGNNPVVRLEDQIVEITGGNGSQDRQLISRVVDGEDVQRPIAHGRASQVGMGETDPVVGVDRHRVHAGLLLFWPNKVPRSAHTAIRFTLQAGADNLAGVKQELRGDLVECLAGNWRQ